MVFKDEAAEEAQREFLKHQLKAKGGSLVTPDLIRQIQLNKLYAMAQTQQKKRVQDALMHAFQRRQFR